MELSTDLVKQTSPSQAKIALFRSLFRGRDVGYALFAAPRGEEYGWLDHSGITVAGRTTSPRRRDGNLVTTDRFHSRVTKS